MSKVKIVESCYKPEGVLVCIANKGTPKEKVVFEEKNLVLNSGSEIMRDILYGDSDQVTKIVFGDMNLDPNVDDVINVAAPALTDTGLVNSLYEKALALSKTTYGGFPSVRYEGTLTEGEFNGSGEQLITEFGLANASDELFSRKTRAAIFKTAETSLTFIWYIVFN